MRKFFLRLVAAAEFYAILISGKFFSISYVVRYLRNPNPIITVKLLKKFGATIGDKSTIKRTLFIDNCYEDQDSKGDFSNIFIGSNCYIGDCVYFDLANKIIIEDNAVISGKVSFITHADCNRSEFLTEKFPRKSASILIENNVWIGFGTTILSGVKVGEKTVVGAHSLVKSNVDPFSIITGIPARKIKSFT